MEKRKNRFNVVDFVIIIVALLLVGAFGLYAFGSLGGAKKEKVIRYTVSIEGFSEEFIDAVKTGDLVKNIDRDCEVGKVVAVYPAEKNVSYNPNVNDGTYVKTEIPDAYRCKIVIESPYTEKDSGYYIDQVEIKTGKKISLKTPTFAFNGLILDIERRDAK